MFSIKKKRSKAVPTGDTNDDTTHATSPALETTNTKRKHDDADAGSDASTPVKRGRNGKMARRECIICCTDVAVNQFPRLPHKNADAHDRGVCLKCWESHLVAEVSSKGWDAVACPQCTEVLSEAEIRKIASGKTYEAWLDKAAKACGESSEEYRPCPRAECGWACFFCTKEDGNIFTCQACGHRQCVLCEVAMHEGETCADYQGREAEGRAREELKRRQVQENAESEAYVGTIAKPCPKCGRQLDKYDGCDHVTCRTCRHEFCWLCCAPYRGLRGIARVGNTAHRQDCAYHPRRLPDMAADVEDDEGDDGWEGFQG